MKRYALGFTLLAFLVTANQANACTPSPCWLGTLGSYYENVVPWSPQSMRESLHETIDDHERFPYTSSEIDTWDVLEAADRESIDSTDIITIYRNARYAKQGGGNDFYNREHTWPKSYGFPDNGPDLNYPYTDMHHLFLADSDYNFNRSNKPFTNCDSNCIEHATDANAGRGGTGGGYPGDSNWTDGEFTDGRWEVWLYRRGDIARAMFYMDVRYAGGFHAVTGAGEPDLILTDDLALIDSANTGNNEPVAYMGMLSTLLRWHREDPVDAAELQHHLAVSAYQFNRNPFIDHPEWVACVFEDNCPVFPLNAGLNDAWYNPVTDGQGFFITVFPDRNLVSLAWFTYDTEHPDEDTQADLGDPGHRWLTALGPITGNQSVMNIDIASGGIFDTFTDIQHTEPVGSDGTITLTFKNCSEGSVEYNMPTIGRHGTVPIQRVVDDNISLCKQLSQPD